MTAKEIILRYSLKLTMDGKHICVGNSAALRRYGDDPIKANRDDILSVLTAEEKEKERAAAERQAKIDAIDGLKEIRTLADRWEQYYAKLHREIESGDSVFTAKNPQRQLTI